MEERLAIIADDFTGAADAGVQFATRGRMCALVTTAASVASDTGWAEVVAFDAESRSLSREAAAHAVRSAVAALRAMGFDRFYKKIDSTLRGNLGAEIDALMEEAECELALVAPSAPRNLRTVVEGRCYVAGRPLAETEYAAGSGDEDASSVAAIIARQSRRPVASIVFSVVRQGAESLAERIAALRREGTEIVVVDATTIEDLAIVADAARGRGASGPARPLLCVGSSGLAEAVAAAGALASLGAPAAANTPPFFPQGPAHDGRQPAARPDLPSLAKEGPILFLVGSRSAVARGQAEELARAGGVFETWVNPWTAASSHGKEVERIAGEVAGRGESSHVLVRVGAATIGADRQLGSGEKRIASLLAEVARALLAAESFGLVVATGGDTAVAAAAALELSALRLHGELLPGVVVASASSLRLRRPITLVTKAGGFGEPDALRRIAASWADMVP